jgi:hypothetical protein
MSKAFEFLLQLGQSLSKDPNVSCLLGLGSMFEISRMDDYSDMDFFLIVEKGCKQSYINHLSWLAIKPIVFQFKNTKDGHKVLFENDVFAEFAVFEKEELPEIAFTEGKIIYAKPGFDLSWVVPKKVPTIKRRSVDFLVNEALTNLYIGLKRDHRGETASAFSFIQVYAASLIVELFQEIYPSKPALIDPFVFERRIENRFTEAFDVLSHIKQGYLNNKASAKAALEFLNTHFDLNKTMYQTILELCG